MKINKQIIEKLNPCKNRFDNYLKYYEDFDSDITEFVLLENITHHDKVWVITKLFTRKQNVGFSLKCASSVLSIFETKYPNDKRPRKAIEAAELYLKTPTKNNEHTFDAASAAYAAAYPDSAAANAAYAAAYAAHAAVYAAAYPDSAAANAAYAAACAAHAAAAANATYAAQQELNLLFAVEIANEKEPEDETK